MVSMRLWKELKHKLTLIFSLTETFHTFFFLFLILRTESYYLNKLPPCCHDVKNAALEILMRAMIHFFRRYKFVS